MRRAILVTGVERKRRNSLIALSGMLLLAAIVLAVGGARIRRATPDDAAKNRWRDYASSVERDARQPSPEAIRALTNAVVLQGEAIVLASEILVRAGLIVGALAVLQMVTLMVGRHAASQDRLGADASHSRERDAVPVHQEPQ